MPRDPRTYQVSQLARIAGVSVRALHHYDELGLLTPSGRTEAGYRLYTDDDLLRLQQILIQRELGFPLEAIRRWLDDPAFDRRAALRQQREAIQRRAELARSMLTSIDRALAMLDGPAPTEDQASLFDGFDPAKHEVEAEERWGHTEAFEVCRTRTRQYTERVWQTIKQEQSGVYAALLEVKGRGHAPDDVAAMEVAERHRRFIDRWFYPCSHAMHEGLASLYEGDRRFAANIDLHGAGLTPFLVAAIRANVGRSAARMI